jgi:hypothetical protein
MSNSELALVAGAALAGLAFVLAIPQPISESDASPIAPAPVLTDRTGVVLASDWKWPITEDAVVDASDTVDTPATEDAPRRRCRRRHCR